MDRYKNGREITEFFTDKKRNYIFLYKLKKQALKRYLRDKRENKINPKFAKQYENRIKILVDEMLDLEERLLRRGWLKEMYENDPEEWLERLAYFEFMRQQEELQVKENMTSSVERPPQSDN